LFPSPEERRGKRALRGEGIDSIRSTQGYLPLRYRQGAIPGRRREELLELGRRGPMVDMIRDDRYDLLAYDRGPTS